MKTRDFMRECLIICALNKPWLYLSLLCGTAMFIFVFQLGNPLLPIPSLSEDGWAWHHIPEILAIFFFGMWIGDFKLLSIKKIDWKDDIFLLIVTVIFALTNMSSPLMVVLVLYPPFYIGYLIKRWHSITKTKT